MARISICITAYQHAAFIAECLESVLGQRTDHELEILIGEDGSTDGTLGICRAYASRDPRIRLLERTKGERWTIEGQVTGRLNSMDLIQRSTGDAVVLLDGDDGWLDDTKLQRQMDRILDEPGCAGSYHHTLLRQGHEPPGDRWRTHLPERMHVEDTIAPVAPFHLSSFMWRRTPAICSALGRPDAWKAISFDMFLFFTVACHGPLVRIDGEASFYRKHGHGITTGPIFSGASINRLRILQWLRADRALDGIHRRHVHAVCDRHVEQLASHPPSGKEKWKWIQGMLRHPAYFLGSSSRLRKVLRALMSR